MRRMLVWVALFAGTPLGCVREPAASTDPSALHPPRAGVNVVLYLIDTLRRDRLGVYGCSEPTSPRIDALARSAFVFEDCTAPAPWTVPSVVSLLTSKYPVDHEVVEMGQKLGSNHTPLAVVMKELGFQTAGFVSNPFAGEATGLEVGYDTFSSQVSASEIRPWLEEVANEPFFLYVHTLEPHSPYFSSPDVIQRFGEYRKDELGEAVRLLREYRQQARKDAIRLRLGKEDDLAAQEAVLAALQGNVDGLNLLYNASVFRADRALGEVVDLLQERGLFERTVFLLVSDHGEEFSDHGGWEHNDSLYAELVRVPMLWKFPDPTLVPRRIASAASLLDVVPTLLDYFGHPDRAAQCSGRSLLPVLQEDRETDPAKVEAVRIHLGLWHPTSDRTRGRYNVRVREARWRLIWNVELDTVELYDAGADPTEQTDLAAANPEVARRLREVARTWLDQRPGARALADRDGRNVQDLDEETQRTLRELGYIE